MSAPATAGVRICGKPTAHFADIGWEGGPCGRDVTHTGRCIDARVIAKYGMCEKHDWLGQDCPTCQREYAAQ